MFEWRSVDPVLGQMGFEFHSKENQTFDKKQALHVTFIQNSLKKKNIYTKQTIMQFSLFLSPALHLWTATW